MRLAACWLERSSALEEEGRYGGFLVSIEEDRCNDLREQLKEKYAQAIAEEIGCDAEKLLNNLSDSYSCLSSSVVGKKLMLLDKLLVMLAKALKSAIEATIEGNGDKLVENITAMRKAYSETAYLFHSVLCQ